MVILELLLYTSEGVDGGDEGGDDGKMKMVVMVVVVVVMEFGVLGGGGGRVVGDCVVEEEEREKTLGEDGYSVPPAHARNELAQLLLSMSSVNETGSVQCGGRRRLLLLLLLTRLTRVVPALLLLLAGAAHRHKAIVVVQATAFRLVADGIQGRRWAAHVLQLVGRGLALVAQVRPLEDEVLGEVARQLTLPQVGVHVLGDLIRRVNVLQQLDEGLQVNVGLKVLLDHLQAPGVKLVHRLDGGGHQVDVIIQGKGSGCCSG